VKEKLAALRPLVERMHVGHCWRKTQDGPRRIAEPFDALKLSEHCAGTNAYGLCPIKPGESTTRVACLDFDSHKGETPWPEMVRIADLVSMTLEIDGYLPHLFRSSGGSGVHLYLVWDEPQDAYSVREMLRTALESCDLKPGTKGVAAGEVEIFPKQNEVPHDGFGSMFILPFAGNSTAIGSFEKFNASDRVPVLNRPAPAAPVSTQIPAELSRVKSALDAIPNCDTQELSYDEWRNVVFAIHHATEGSDEGLALAEQFSSRSPKHDSDFLYSRVWPYIRSDRGGEVVTERTLFAAAAEHGWCDPAIADAFDVVEDTASDAAEARAEELGRLKRFIPIQAAEFAKGSPADWIVKGVLPDADLAVVFGESQSGKSFFVLDLIATVARGAEWRGKRTRVSKAVYIAAEGAGGFRNRLNAYSAHHNVPLSELDVAVIPDAPNFMLADDIKALIAAVKAYGHTDLIVVDTFAQVMPGANENAGEDVGKALSHCKALRRATGAMVILIHHSGKDASRGARGWSGLRAAADCEIEIIRAEHDRVATVTKLKDGADGAEFGFKLLEVAVGMDDDGETVSSCVVEYTSAISKEKRNMKPKGENERLVWQAVIDCQGLDGTPPNANDVIEEAISHLVRDPDAKRDRRREVIIRALNGLRDAGRVIVNGDQISLPTLN
jgi:hypothetical protein